MNIDFFKVLPERITLYIGSILGIIYTIKFFKASEIEKLFENKIAKLIRTIINEIILFVILTIIVIMIFKPTHNKHDLVQILMIITFGLNLICLDLPNCKFQYYINKLSIRFTGKISFYKYFIYILHIFFVLLCYSIYIRNIVYSVAKQYNKGKEISIDIIIDTVKNYFTYIYVYLIGFAMVYAILRIYLYPTFKLFRKKLDLYYRVDIKLSNGDVLNNMYLLDSFNNNYVLGRSNAIDDYDAERIIISKDKVSYIKVSSKSSLCNKSNDSLIVKQGII